MTTGIDVRPVGPDEVGALGQLFAAERTTRHCWCTSPCSSRLEFAAGWFGGGNRRRFEAMTTRDPAPMGVLALLDGTPVGWAACGPRRRYLGSRPERSPLLRGRPRVEDDTVWLLPCLFVHAEHRSRGVTHALVGAAVSLARRHGAVAVEGWPLPASGGRSADAYLGREQLFSELGFRCVDRPVPGRVVMRLDLGPS